MTRSRKVVFALLMAPALLAATVVEAQWAFVARRALGRVEQMSQAPGNGTPGYDVATVMIQANARKVYETALKTVQASPNLHITRQDDQQLSLDVTDGKHGVGLRVSQINTMVAQLLIAANAPAPADTPPDQPKATSVAVRSVLRVCQEMNVKCAVGTQ